MNARKNMSLSSVSVWISLSSSSRSTSITSLGTVAEIRPRKRPPDRIERSPVNMPRVNLGMFTVEAWSGVTARSEEHTSELQSQSNLVCRLLLEKKKKHDKILQTTYASRQTDNQ